MNALATRNGSMNQLVRLVAFTGVDAEVRGTVVEPVPVPVTDLHARRDWPNESLGHHPVHTERSAVSARVDLDRAIAAVQRLLVSKSGAHPPARPAPDTPIF